MRTCHIDAVRVDEDRVRKHFDPAAIDELAESIRVNGLYHAPVFRADEGDKWVLVAGERRLRAMRQLVAAGHCIRYDSELLPAGFIPFVIPGDLDIISALMVELEENVIRRDISWQERVRAEERLHTLRCQVNPSNTFADTAAIIYGDAPTPRETHDTKINVILARHLDDPDVASAKNEREAVQIARRKLESLFTEELANRLPESSAVHQLIHADAKVFLATCPPNTIDCIITDPPYGINADTFSPQSNQVDQSLNHHYTDTLEAARDIVTSIANSPALKHDCHVFMFCDLRRFLLWADIFQSAGFYVWPQPLIWDKGLGNLLGNSNGPRHCYEAILFAQRGFKRYKESTSDVIHIRADTNKLHAAQKPVELYTYLLKLSCDPGDTVLDPCCGSGTVFPAATALKLKAIGVELNDDAYNLAKTRLNDI